MSSAQVDRSAAEVGRLLRGETDQAEVWCPGSDIHKPGPHLLGYAYATDTPGKYRVTNTVHEGFIEASPTGFRSTIVARNGTEVPLSERRGFLYAFLAAVGGDGVPDDNRKEK